MSSKETILNIPNPPSRSRSDFAPPDSRPEINDLEDDELADEEEEGIGEFDDGRSGKLTLGVLLQEGLVKNFPKKFSLLIFTKVAFIKDEF
jgi:hypothetical protein